LKKNKTYTIKNTSKYSTAYLKVLIDFAIQHTEIGAFKKLPIIVKNKDRSWSGTANYDGWERWVNLNISKNILPFSSYKFPYDIADSRFKYSPSFIINNRTEVILHLIAHELYHTVDPNIRTSTRSRKEFVANVHSYKVIIKFREVQDTVWKKIVKEMRKENMVSRKIFQAKIQKRKKEAEKKTKKKEQRKLKNTVEYKLEKNRKLLAKWDKVMLNAQKKSKEYQKKVNYYVKAVARKAQKAESDSVV